MQFVKRSYFVLGRSGFFVSEESGIGLSEFEVLHSEYPHINGVSGIQAVNMNGSGLSGSVNAIDGLVFDGLVPPRVEHDGVVGAYDIDADTTGVNLHEDDFVMRERDVVKDGLAFSRRQATVEKESITIDFKLKEFFEKNESLSVFGEDDDLFIRWSGVDDVDDLVELGGGVITCFDGVIRIMNDVDMDADLHESCDFGENIGEADSDGAIEERLDGFGGFLFEYVVNFVLFGGHGKMMSVEVFGGQLECTVKFLFVNEKVRRGRPFTVLFVDITSGPVSVIVVWRDVNEVSESS